MKKLALAILLFIILCFSASALTKSDFVELVETKVDITKAYTHYRVCNPTGSEYSINSASDFGVDFTQPSGSLNSYRILRLENTSYEVDDYLEYCNNETIEVFTSEQNETPYVNVSYLNCSKEYLGKETRYYMEWQEFTPVGNSFSAGECYDIRIEGTYDAATSSNPVAIDNILEYAGYTFEEYDWWNASWNEKLTVEIEYNAGLSGNTKFPLKVILNSSYITYADFQPNGEDLRFINSTEDGQLDYFIEVWNTSGDSIVYVNTSISNSANTTIYLYYNSTENTSSSDFVDTFGSTLEVFYSMTEDANDLANKYNATHVTASHTTYTDSIEQTSGAYDFSGSATYISNTAVGLVDGSADFTICLWGRRDGDSNDDRTSIVGTMDTSNDGFSMYVTDGDDTLKIYNGGESATSEVIGTGDVNHYCLAHNDGANNMTLYFNTTNILSIGGPGSTTASTLELGLMYENSASQYNDMAWNGIMDEFRLYSSLKSEDFIKLLHTQPAHTISAVESSTPIGESEAREAIEEGIQNALTGNYTIYTDQQVYARHVNTSQQVGMFDKFVVYTNTNQRWGFNYDNTSSSSFTYMFNITPVFYVLEFYNETVRDNIVSNVQNYITATKAD